VPQDPRPSPLAMALLGLLVGGPLHPYGMQRLIKEWGKDQVVNVGHRANLYKTIKRLDEAGLIAVRGTERDQQYPERTVYQITAEGRQLVLDWLAAMVSVPRNEFPEFPAALSFVMLLGPEASHKALCQRAEHLRQELGRHDEELALHSGRLPRVTLLETEYMRAMVAAELEWVTATADELASGALGWAEEDFAEAAAFYEPD
jgi:DNA-binding PadR family transcriptional regulator